VNPSFDIQTSTIETETAQLFAEAGPMGISAVILGADNYFKAVVSYACSNKLNRQELTGKLQEILQTENLLTRQYAKTHIFWSFPESILVPAGLVDADKNIEMLDLVYGDLNKGITKSDFLYKHNLHNIYRVPEPVHELFMEHLPYATQTHQYSTMVNREMSEGNHLYAVFYSSSLTLMLSKQDKLQVIQNFIYDNPEDTAYHLLNVCKSFDVQPNKVTLHISGLVDEKSNLYAAIYKYFLLIEFDGLPADFSYSDEIEEHPPHFFAHLFAFASCV
jgi:hypothetical protein